jgi:hypothetical protein
MAMHKKRKGTARGARSSRRNPPRRRATIESGGRSSDAEPGERA